MPKRVLATGVFDVFHAGHLFFLEQARRYGDELVVLVTSDEVARHESKKPMFSAKQRASLIKKIGIANTVVIGRGDGDIVKTVKTLAPDVIALGYDQPMDIGWLTNLLDRGDWHGTIVRVTKLPSHA
ncbi:adenylyltransferase/cytidyltransferase family protein [Candidatus Berkelbacteria bacterium]|nr:adenylyltransferase/cytidyltransferase family protein [Candidatus Berkelbacteria bacterium]